MLTLTLLLSLICQEALAASLNRINAESSPSRAGFFIKPPGKRSVNTGEVQSEYDEESSTAESKDDVALMDSEPAFFYKPPKGRKNGFKENTSLTKNVDSTEKRWKRGLKGGKLNKPGLKPGFFFKPGGK